ncbi:MAG: cytochrome c biogenesis protein [Parachlamydiaceae bacterium]
MKRLIFLILVCLCCFIEGAETSDFSTVPVSYQGRFLPAENYAKQWIYHLSHKTSVPDSTPLDALWLLHFFGHSPFDETPLFWIEDTAIKTLLGLEQSQSRYSYDTLQHAFNIEISALKEPPLIKEIERLLQHLMEFKQLQGSQSDKTYENAFLSLKNQQLSSQEISLQLEQQHPLIHRLSRAGELFKVLPGKFKPGEWYSLHALHTKLYSPKTQQLELVKNFTLYSDELFEIIRQHYFLLEKAIFKNQAEKISALKAELASDLNQGYALIANTPYTEALGKQLRYPSKLQLKAESFYASYPLTFYCIIAYAIALGLYLVSFKLKTWPFLPTLAFLIFLIACILHTTLLALRCYILGRPPVTNMFETVLYVPWIAVIVSIALWQMSKTHLPLIASTLTALILLTILQLNFYVNSFENVQAVLDSQYWLLIHVLMVVGSYGLFLLASLLGHLYVGGIAFYKRETKPLQILAKSLVQTLYIGVVLLIAGTVLGGVWAAQSWGRFWDWDPKESWAFISICIYLLWIHAYRFKKIQSFGIAVGSIIGFLAISFTWYGVNYILGTGLHSYGFGSGGIHYYYGYLIAELLFLVAAIQIFRSTKGVDKKTPTC